MYIYEIGYSGYEGGCSTVLLHEKQFSETEWQAMVKEAMVAAIAMEYDHQMKEHQDRLPRLKAEMDDAFAAADWLTYADRRAKMEVKFVARLTPSDVIAPWSYREGGCVEEELIARFGFQHAVYTHRTFFVEDMEMANLPTEADRANGNGPDAFEMEIINEVRDTVVAYEEGESWHDSREWDREQEIFAELGLDKKDVDNLRDKRYGITKNLSEDDITQVWPTVSESILHMFGQSDEGK